MDLFSLLCRATDEEDNRYTDQEVIDHMIFLMMAAHDTTTSTLASMTYALARNPQWQQTLYEEVAALGVGQLRWEDLERMQQTEWVMKEALRMYPPLSTLPKYSLKAFEFEGQRIPAGAMVATYPIHTHYMEEYWSSRSALTRSVSVMHGPKTKTIPTAGCHSAAVRTCVSGCTSPSCRSSW